jgi:hypothetical protein
MTEMPFLRFTCAQNSGEHRAPNFLLQQKSHIHDMFLLSFNRGVEKFSIGLQSITRISLPESAALHRRRRWIASMFSCVIVSILCFGSHSG